MLRVCFVLLNILDAKSSIFSFIFIPSYRFVHMAIGKHFYVLMPA